MKKFVLLTFVSFLFAGAIFAQKQETMKINVYFHNEKLNPGQTDCRKVFPTERVIPKTKGVAVAALNEYLKGANADEKQREFWSLDPDSTNGVLNSLKIKNGSAYVNFNKSVYDKLGVATTSCGGGFFSGLEATLMQFPTIKKVFYAIEKSPADFYDWVQVGECPDELKNCDNSNF